MQEKRGKKIKLILIRYSPGIPDLDSSMLLFILLTLWVLRTSTDWLDGITWSGWLEVQLSDMSGDTGVEAILKSIELSSVISSLISLISPVIFSLGSPLTMTKSSPVDDDSTELRLTVSSMVTDLDHSGRAMVLRGST